MPQQLQPKPQASQSQIDFSDGLVPNQPQAMGVSKFAKPGPYATKLDPNQEQQFEGWVKQNKVPWQDSPTSDYDMRGYWKAQQAGDPNARQAANKHFPDTYKTPYHKTFSNESEYATPGAPHWEGDKLVPTVDFQDGLVPHEQKTGFPGLSKTPQGYMSHPTETMNLDKQPYPQWLETGLEKSYQYGVQPFEKMSQWGAEKGAKGAELGLKTFTHTPMPEANFQTREPSPTEVGAARGIGSVAGGTAADPRQWAFFAEGLVPKMMGTVSPMMSKALGLGFTGQMGVDTAQGAYDIHQNWGQMNPEQRAEAVTKVGTSAAMTGMGAMHLFSDGLVPHGERGRAVVVGDEVVKPDQFSGAVSAKPGTKPQTTASIPPDRGAVGAIQDMHKAAFGQEGGPTPSIRTGEGRAEAIGQKGIAPSDTAQVGERRTTEGVSPTGVERRYTEKDLPGLVEKAKPTGALQTPAFDQTRTDLQSRIEAAKAALQDPKLSKAQKGEALRQLQSSMTEAAVGKAKPPQPNMRTEPAGLQERLVKQAQDLKITPETAARKATLGAGATPEDVSKIQAAPGSKPGFRWSALSDTEKQRLMEMGAKPQEKPRVPTTVPETPKAAPASKESIQPRATEAPAAPAPKGPVEPSAKPAAAEPVRGAEVAKKPLPSYITEQRGNWFTQSPEAASNYAGRGGKIDYVDVPKSVADATISDRSGALTKEHILPKEWTSKAKPATKVGGIPEGHVRLFRGYSGEFDEAGARGFAPESPAQTAKDLAGPSKLTNLDQLKRRVASLGGDDKTINSIIKAADSVGGTAKERTERALEGLRNYGSSLAKSKGGLNKATKGEAGFFSLRGKPSPKKQSATQAYKSSMEKLSGTIEGLPKDVPVDEKLKAASAAVAKQAQGTGGLTNTMLGMRAMGKTLADWYMHPEKGQKLSEAMQDITPSKDWKKLLGNYSEGRQQTKYSTAQFVKEVKKATGPLGREGIVNYIQAAGDMAKLKSREAASTGKLALGYKAAQELSPKEQRIAEAVKTYFDERLAEAQKLGILDHGLENYVTQIWEKDTPFRRGLLAEINAGRFKTNFQYAKQRFHESYFEGEQKGLAPKNKDVGYLIAKYESALNEAVMARKFVKDLYGGTAADGRPLIVPESRLARPMKDPTGAIEGRAIPLHGTGRGKLMSVQLAQAAGIPLDMDTLTAADKARTETADYVRIDHPAFRTWQFSLPGEGGGPDVFAEADAKVHPDIAKHLKNMYTNSWFRSYGPTRAFMKSQAFIKQTLLGVPGFHYVQEGFHAVAHKVNPLNPDLWSGERLKSAMKDPILQRGMQAGLMLYDHDAVSNYGEGMTSVFTKLPKVGAYFEAAQEHLFQTYIPGLKATMYKRALSSNMKAYAKELSSGKINARQMEEITAAQANAAFGELNYDWLGRNKNAQDLFRLAALAPDFLEARARFAGQALRPYGHEQRMALALRLGVYQYLIARTLNMVTNQGDPVMDPKYAFQWKIGSRVYGLRSMASDLIHATPFVGDPNSFLHFRMSPITRMVVQSGAKFYGGKEFTFKDMLKEIAPIPIQGLIQDWLSNGTPKDKKALDNALQGLGVQSEKYRTPEERKGIEDKEERRQRSLHGERSPRQPKGMGSLGGLKKKL